MYGEGIDSIENTLRQGRKRRSAGTIQTTHHTPRTISKVTSIDTGSGLGSGTRTDTSTEKQVEVVANKFLCKQSSLNDLCRSK